MKNVKIPVAHRDCILTEREKERWGRGDGVMETGRDGETAVERERREKTEGFLAVGF